MSDQEINCLVAKQFPETYLFNEEGNPYQLIPDSMAAYSGSDFDEVEFQPCGNPADAWPIIVDNRISIYSMSVTDARGRWGAEAPHPHDAYHFNDNPLRASMLVFLKMQESANVPANSTGSDLR